MRTDQGMLILATIASVVLWAIPITRPLLLPVTFLNTHLHELCHALAAVATGGSVESISVLSNGSGSTPVSGGNITLVASAGYVGSAVLGALIIFFGRTERSARIVFWFLGATMAVSLALFVRGDLVGVLSGAGWTVLFIFLGMKAKGWFSTFFAQFVGVQQCLAAFQSILVLLNLALTSEVQSDAKILESATGLPALGWAILWSALSLVLVFFTLKLAWRTPQKATKEPARPDAASLQIE